MHNYSKLSVLIAGIALLLAACQRQEEAGKTRIILQAAKGFSSEVKISTLNMLTSEYAVLVSATPDSNGSAVLEFELTQPMFAQLEVGEVSNRLYLSPGDELQLSVSNVPSEERITYAGRSAGVNTYLAEVAKIGEQYERWNVPRQTFIYSLAPQPFLDRVDSLQNSLAHLHRQYVDSLHFPEEVAALLEKRNHLGVLNLKQNYALGYREDADLPKSLQEVTDEIPFDASYLHAGLSEYAWLLRMYLDAKIYVPYYKDKSFAEIDSLQDQILLLADQELKKGAYPAEIQEYLRARNIFQTMEMDAPTPAVHSLLNSFKQEHAASTYLPLLEEKRQAWQAVEPGKPAPDIAGTTPEGEKVSLSQLKGKVVYADVWATWCAPCRQEIPYAKELKKQFAGTDEVVFLYVSVDDDQEAWKKMLADDPEFTGTHLFVKGAWDAPFMKAYQISGIPRYILIDQEGKIVQADASRPSSGKVPQEINALLAKGKGKVVSR